MLSKPLLTVHEVAALLKMRESTVRAWINDGQLRGIKFGRDWRVSQRDLEAFINAHANRELEPEELATVEQSAESLPDGN